MCVINVTAGMRETTCTQALAHNIDTIHSDVAKYLRQYIYRHPDRSDRDATLKKIDDITAYLSLASKLALELWSEALCRELNCPADAPQTLYSRPDPAASKHQEPTHRRPRASEPKPSDIGAHWTAHLQAHARAGDAFAADLAELHELYAGMEITDPGDSQLSMES